MVETAPTPTPTPAEQPSFGSVFEEVTQKYSNERANEVMDLAVLHEDIFAKIPSSHDADVYNAAIATITPEENQILTDLVNTYGREAVVAARKVSRGMQHGDKARGSAEAKIKVLERMKRARGAGDTTDLDTRIAKLQSAVDRTENSEKTRNEIKRTQVQRAAYNEAKNVDPYDFWGMEDTTASRTNTTNLRPEITEALTSYETTLKATRETYANATAKARRSGVGRFLLGDQKFVGKVMRKSERLSKLIDSVNTRLDKSVTNARTAYEDVLNEYGGAVAHLLQERGITGYDLRVAAAQGLLDEGKALFDETAEREKALGGDKRMKFTDWWVKNDSKDTNNILGKGKKYAVLAGVGLAVGTGAGLIGMTAWAGSALGGGAASLIAERVNRKRASAAVEVNDDGSIFTVADQKADAVAANSENLLNEAANSGDGFASADALTAAQEHQTDQDKLGNRRRIRIAFSAGALGARAGVSLGSGIKNAVTGGGKPSTSTLATEKPNSGTSNWSPAEKDAFKQMMKWRQEQLSINPTLTDQELAKGFNQYLQGIK